MNKLLLAEFSHKIEVCKMWKPVSLILIPVKLIEQINLKDKHITDKKVTGSSQHGFTKGKSCQTNWIAFYLTYHSGDGEISGYFLSSQLQRGFWYCLP